MQETHPVPDTEMVRIPGLYRRWELPEVLKNHHAFRIEDAGAHQDGTPLLAIYAGADGDARAVPTTSRMAAPPRFPARPKRARPPEEQRTRRSSSCRPPPSLRPPPAAR